MKVFLCLVALLFVPSLFANDDLDLEANMKNTGLAFKNSVEATQLPEFNTAIDEFITLVKRSKSATFHKQAEQSLQGLDKVIAKAELAKKLANEQGLDAAKGPLKAIDGLRKQYHKLHEPPGFWELLFGK
ncbi:cytochrome b562 [Pseudoalteromonas ostreae]|uniref:cytochrome b562 n=1 Tax=Pseudoalteromonas ostreae TaxID=2774154 RepID=UPI001B35CE21|nr:cytochrome b562 [Pseudoalteromonas ostreae]